MEVELGLGLGARRGEAGHGRLLLRALQTERGWCGRCWAKGMHGMVAGWCGVWLLGAGLAGVHGLRAGWIGLCLARIGLGLARVRLARCGVGLASGPIPSPGGRAGKAGARLILRAG